jgi:hypothetical protein
LGRIEKLLALIPNAALQALGLPCQVEAPLLRLPFPGREFSLPLAQGVLTLVEVSRTSPEVSRFLRTTRFPGSLTFPQAFPGVAKFSATHLDFAIEFQAGLTEGFHLVLAPILFLFPLALSPDQFLFPALEAGALGGPVPVIAAPQSMPQPPYPLAVALDLNLGLADVAARAAQFPVGALHLLFKRQALLAQGSTRRAGLIADFREPTALFLQKGCQLRLLLFQGQALLLRSVLPFQ